MGGSNVYWRSFAWKIVKQMEMMLQVFRSGKTAEMPNEDKHENLTFSSFNRLTHEAIIYYLEKFNHPGAFC